MTSFFLALLATFAATVGGREAVRVARLSAALGNGRGLLAANWLICGIACAIAAGLGSEISAGLAPAGKAILVAIALLLAAGELLALRSSRRPAEPTRSLGAIALVLGTAQLTSAAGFLVFALAAATAGPWLVAAGGTLGSGVALTIASSAGRDWEARVPLRVLRNTVAGLLFVAALATALSARGLLG